MPGTGELPLLELRVFGNVSDSFVALTKESLRSAYEAFSEELPPRVEVRIVDGLLTLQELCEIEKEETGRDVFGEEGYLTQHEVTEAGPRITICWQRADELPALLGTAALQHEAAHSVLHATLAHSEFALSEALLKDARARGVGLNATRTILLLASRAVKDFEASRLLARSGLRAPQTALAVFHFAETAKERPPWSSVARSNEGRTVYAAHHLHPVLYSEPLQTSDSNLSEISSAITQALADMDEDEREDLLSLSAFLSEDLAADTHENAAKAAALVLERFAPKV